MSPHEGDSDVEQRGTEEANGSQPGRGGAGGGWGGSRGAGAFGEASEEAFGALQEGGRGRPGPRQPGQETVQQAGRCAEGESCGTGQVQVRGTEYSAPFGGTGRA